VAKLLALWNTILILKVSTIIPKMMKGHSSGNSRSWWLCSKTGREGCNRKKM